MKGPSPMIANDNDDNDYDSKESTFMNELFLESYD